MHHVLWLGTHATQIIELYLDRVKHGKIDIEAIAKSTMGATGTPQ